MLREYSSSTIELIECRSASQPTLSITTTTAVPDLRSILVHRRENTPNSLLSMITNPSRSFLLPLPFQTSLR